MTEGDMIAAVMTERDIIAVMIEVEMIAVMIEVEMIAVMTEVDMNVVMTEVVVMNEEDMSEAIPRGRPVVVGEWLTLWRSAALSVLCPDV